MVETIYILFWAVDTQLHAAAKAHSVNCCLLSYFLFIVYYTSVLQRYVYYAYTYNLFIVYKLKYRKERRLRRF